VQQACTIIQSAAHEDANIIFGAVMDEKMKDAVKITVIATGFREVSRSQHRIAEAHHSFASSHDDAMGLSNMDFPDPVGPPQSTPVFAEQFHQPASESMMESPVATAHAGAEVISLDSMRNAMVANFEQDDLDVPAFLRKRGEVM
jgi:cell division protein FtsZ